MLESKLKAVIFRFRMSWREVNIIFIDKFYEKSACNPILR